jgi:cellobionic acid phosphorylase
MKVTREFRGATFQLDIRRESVKDVTVKQGGRTLPEPRIADVKAGEVYQLTVLVPQ